MRRYVYLLAMATVISAGSAFAGSNYSYTTNGYNNFAPQQNYVQPQANYAQPQQMNYSQQTNYSVEPVILNTDVQPVYAQAGTLRGSVVTVPAGQCFKAVVTTPISSANMFRGQDVSIALGSNFYYNGQLIAPAGSTVTGMVIDAAKAKHGSMNGRVSVRFTNIVTPTGLQIPISAVIKTDDNSGVLVGGTAMDVTKEYGKDLTVGAGAGALTGVVMSAMGGGNIGKTAALGTAVGAGGGLVKSLWDKGNDVEIPANSQIDLYLTQPITVVPVSQ